MLLVSFLTGSDGSRWSNYKRYIYNHHEACSVCCADKRNPYNKRKRALTFWNKAGLAFLLAIAFAAFNDPQTFADELVESIIIALILNPYGIILDGLGRCSLCHRSNICVGTARFFGSCTLGFFFILSLVNILGGLIILFCHKDRTSCAVSQAAGMGNFLMNFVLSLILDQVLSLVTGSFNWIFYSWAGCLCCPVCRCHVPSKLQCFLCFFCQETDKKNEDSAVENTTNSTDGGQRNGSDTSQLLCICPTKYSCCSLLTFFPIRKILNLHQLAENTFDDDKKLFQEQYPGRIAIDDVKNNAMNTEQQAPESDGTDNPIIYDDAV